VKAGAYCCTPLCEDGEKREKGGKSAKAGTQYEVDPGGDPTQEVKRGDFVMNRRF